VPRAATERPHRRRRRPEEAEREILEAAEALLRERPSHEVTRHKRVAVRVPVRGLRPGRHAISVVAVDAHGNQGQRNLRFRRC
jgi:hypothetical protein